MKPTHEIVQAYKKVLEEIDRDFDNPIHEAVLKSKALLLKWILDLEDTTLETDDCIMDETIVAEIQGEGVFKDLQIDIKISHLDEPYKTILKKSAGLPLPTAIPIPEHVVVQVLTTHPNGTVGHVSSVISVSSMEKSLNNQDVIETTGNNLKKVITDDLKARYGNQGFVKP